MKALLSIIAMFFMAESSVHALECVVGSEEEFIEAIEDIAKDGACRTDSAAYREAYEEYRGQSLVFHVIRFDKPLAVDSKFGCLTGFNGEPLIIISTKEERATIGGFEPVCVDGKGGPVIIDGVTFADNDIHINGDSNAIVNSKVTNGTVKIYGDSNRLKGVEIEKSQNNGLEFFGSGNRADGVKITGGAKFGVLIEGEKNKILNGSIRNNASGGVRVKSCADPACSEMVTALISKTAFIGNSGEPISVDKVRLAAPVNVMVMESPQKWTVTGNLDLSSYRPNLNAVAVELYDNGMFAGEVKEIDKESGQFVYTIPKLLESGGKVFKGMTFRAIAVDYENNETSPFSSVKQEGSADDWDGDGIPNTQEDYNNNGLVDFGETDPRNADTDGDGLTDGEERLHIGRVKELMEKGLVFADLAGLDPTVPDSDGDCIQDGVELGLVVAPAPAAQDAISLMKAVAGSGEAVEPKAALTSYCRAILKSHGLLEPKQGDADAKTTTDPTNADSDNDGLKDGEEDWNFNGARDVKGAGVEPGVQIFLETDPNNPDSDGDNLLDGAEGDKNGDGLFSESETDPLLADTDDDGVADDVEVRQYGSLPNKCDSDSDGLSDGIEAGVIHPTARSPDCVGLQMAGSNFTSIGVLSLTTDDSDGDGLKDGDEDKNHNGWLDFGETDPTTKDTDNDGIDDYFEERLDIDRDGFPDIDISILKNGKKCEPPAAANDLDCDGVINARDPDSDGDGCLDRDEGMFMDRNADGIPDVWDQTKSSCGAPGSQASGGGGTGSSSSTANNSPSGATSANAQMMAPAERDNPFSGAEDGGCSMITSRGGTRFGGAVVILMSVILIVVRRIVCSSRETRKIVVL